MPRADGKAKIIAEQQTWPQGVCADGTGVFWVTSSGLSGSVMSVATPP